MTLCVNFGGERGNGEKMAFTFGRGQAIERGLRYGLGHFSIGKRQKGCYLQSCATNTNHRRAPQCCLIKQRQGMYREHCARSTVLSGRETLNRWRAKLQRSFWR